MRQIKDLEHVSRPQVRETCSGEIRGDAAEPQHVGIKEASLRESILRSEVACRLDKRCRRLPSSRTRQRLLNLRPSLPHTQMARRPIGRNYGRSRLQTPRSDLGRRCGARRVGACNMSYARGRYRGRLAWSVEAGLGEAEFAIQPRIRLLSLGDSARLSPSRRQALARRPLKRGHRLRYSTH
jgi:hypothetical protein